MRLRTLVMELERIEGDIRELEKVLREKREVKRKIWLQIIKHPEVREIYWEYGWELRSKLKKKLAESGYKG